MARPTQREVAKSEIVNMRVTKELKDALFARAKRAGRSLSYECELRLMESLNYDFDIGWRKPNGYICRGGR